MKLKVRVGKYEQEINFMEDDDIEISIEGKHHIWTIKRSKR